LLTFRHGGPRRRRRTARAKSGARKKIQEKQGKLPFSSLFWSNRWLPLRFRSYWSLVPARPRPASNLEIAPYSGPAPACGTIARAEAAYFQMLNDEGGVNGRKIGFGAV
jgi:hypothetical protein